MLTEEGVFNYAAYLIADENNLSIKVAKYKGLNRLDLSENNEYGYCSIVKATKSVLDKIELENFTTAKITCLCHGLLGLYGDHYKCFNDRMAAQVYR